MTESDLFERFDVKRAPMDGNCFYHSFAMANSDGAQTNAKNVDQEHILLRKQANDAKNKSFLLENEKKQRELGVWAEMVEIQGLVDVQNVKIHVFLNDPKKNKIQQLLIVPTLSIGNPKTIFLYNINNKHFDALFPKNVDILCK